MHLAIADAASHGGAGAWRKHRIENINIEADPELFRARLFQLSIKLSETLNNPMAVHVVHRDCETTGNVAVVNFLTGIHFAKSEPGRAIGRAARFSRRAACEVLPMSIRQ